MFHPQPTTFTILFHHWNYRKTKTVMRAQSHKSVTKLVSPLNFVMCLKTIPSKVGGVRRPTAIDWVLESMTCGETVGLIFSICLHE